MNLLKSLIMLLYSSPSSAVKYQLLAASLIASSASNTEYVCNNGEYCQLSSNGGMCSPTALGLPSSYIFSTSLTGTGATAGINHQCIGFPDYDLASSNGNCIMNCPSSCTVTQYVAFPCSNNNSDGMFGLDSGIFDGANSAVGNGGGINEFQDHGTSVSASGTSSGADISSITSGGSDPFAYTEYTCNSGSQCTLVSNGGICSPIGILGALGFNPTAMSGGSISIPYQCVGISNRDLVSGGGSCLVKCPDSCEVISDVKSACGDSGFGDTGNFGFNDEGGNPADFHAIGTLVSAAVLVAAAASLL